MKNLFKTWTVCVFAIIFGVGVIAAAIQPVEAKAFKTVLLAEADQKKPAEPGKTSDEEDGGCKC
jgi:hypothetical protein